MRVLIIHYKKILREIEDHIRALSSNVIEYADNRLAYTLYREEYYNFSPKSISLSQL